jgi:hypothetical protein
MNAKYKEKLKLYSDYLNSVGLKQEQPDQYNAWKYIYKPGELLDDKKAYWLVDLLNSASLFEPKIYRFDWVVEGNEVIARDLYTPGEHILLCYQPDTFEEFKNLVKQQIEELKKYELIRKEMLMRIKLDNINRDFK